MRGKIVVLGAGYAGLPAAKLAARWTDAQVTLVNASDRFVERVRLHQLAAGQQLSDLPIAGLLQGSGVRLVVDRVTAIDPVAHIVTLAGSDEPLHYDQLIYALGSRVNLDAFPGAAEHAYTVAGEEQARNLERRLPDSETVAVVGAGLTGLEVAAELAECHPRLKVRLVGAGMLGAGLSAKGQNHLRQTFARLGVEVRENARVAEVRRDGVLLDDGDHVAADTVVWTAGFEVSPLAREAGLTVDDSGRVIVDELLRSLSHPDVTVVGDAASAHLPDGQELRMACATSIPMAQQAVRALAARREGKEPKALRFRYVNQCISLGRRDGLIQFVHADDSPREGVITGRFAALYKETVVRATILFQRHPTLPTGV
ncbi:NAD(P)/FAD-dependent oxidoreductase [Pseudonocardia spinosispora]|uniref:NAD(P)/FAD-dependent oxidoreductase n=1 Tax=Pseudonocardia spinosispora TaxID=103441 RepID=UPI0004222996|nr:FAD-dependent oxidoreductase [Pseudonocardia spinosispora]